MSDCLWLMTLCFVILTDISCFPLPNQITLVPEQVSNHSCFLCSFIPFSHAYFRHHTESPFELAYSTNSTSLVNTSTSPHSAITSLDLSIKHNLHTILIDNNIVLTINAKNTSLWQCWCWWKQIYFGLLAVLDQFQCVANCSTIHLLDDNIFLAHYCYLHHTFCSLDWLIYWFWIIDTSLVICDETLGIRVFNLSPQSEVIKLCPSMMHILLLLLFPIIYFFLGFSTSSTNWNCFTGCL